MILFTRSNAAILLFAASFTEGLAINTDSNTFIHFKADFLGLMSKKGCSIIIKGVNNRKYLTNESQEKPFFCILLLFCVESEAARFMSIRLGKL